MVGGYYIDWGTIPLDNIEKIEIIRGGSSVRYSNNALGGVVKVITKKPTQTPEATFFGTYGGGEDIDAIQNYRLTHAYKVGPLGYSLLSCYVENLFDEAYEEQFGYPMPGFIVGAAVKLSL